MLYSQRNKDKNYIGFPYQKPCNQESGKNKLLKEKKHIYVHISTRDTGKASTCLLAQMVYNY